MTPNEIISDANTLMRHAMWQAEDALIKVLKAYNGLIPTPPKNGRYMEATIYCDGYEESWYTAKIFGIRYDEEEGIMLLTSNGISNYEYDEEYAFDYLYDFEGEDLKHFNDVVNNISYYEPLKDGDTEFDEMKTIYSITLLLSEFLYDGSVKDIND